jgi:hypothetical protein
VPNSDLTIEGVERIARTAIRERLRNASAEHAIIDVCSGAPESVLLQVNSGGNALAAEDALRAAGYQVESSPAGRGAWLRVTRPNPSGGEDRG